MWQRVVGFVDEFLVLLCELTTVGAGDVCLLLLLLLLLQSRWREEK